MRRLPLAVVLSVVLPLVVSAPAAGRVPGVDWWDRPVSPVELPDAWSVVGCEGDAPLLCTTEGKAPQGVVEYIPTFVDGELRDDLVAGVPERLALTRELQRFHTSVRQDRGATCPTMSYLADPTVGARVGGRDGVRYGFSLFNEDNVVVERTIGLMALRPEGEDLVLDVVTAAEIDEGSCVSPEGSAPFTGGALDRFTPNLVQLVARSTFGPAGVPIAGVGGDVLMVADDAVATSVAMSQLALPDGAPDGIILVARDDDFADALSSGGAQGRFDAPLLLTGSSALDPRVAEEVKRLGSEGAILLGGEAAVSPQVVADLEALGLTVDRVAGPDRIGTALALADYMGLQVQQVVLARAFGSSSDPSQAFADSIAAGAVAASFDTPMLLTDSNTLDPRVADWLEANLADDLLLESVLIAGGEAAIGLPVRQEIVEIGLGIDPAFGPERAATAVALALRRGLLSGNYTDTVILADARDWVAGVTAPLLATQTLAPVLLTDGLSFPAATQDYLLGTDVDLVCTPAVQASAGCESATTP